ncbi:hypothetical protein ACFQU9_21290 [Actinomadura namibiensis]|uniref:hypothetical protein n=1 Tax=Actinomadura kijaniata TaxID=46161 RepID=UPI0036201832
MMRWDLDDLTPIWKLMERDGRGDQVRMTLAQEDAAAAWGLAADWAWESIDGTPHRVANHDRDRRAALDDTVYGDTLERVGAVLADEGFSKAVDTALWPEASGAGDGERIHQVALWYSGDGLLVETVYRAPTSSAGAVRTEVDAVRLYWAGLVPVPRTPPSEQGWVDVPLDRSSLAYAIYTLHEGPSVPHDELDLPLRLLPGGPDGACLVRKAGASCVDHALRVHLAALRASTRLVVPWPDPVVGVLGGTAGHRNGDEAAHTNTLRIIGMLPAEVRERFGRIVPVSPPAGSSDGGPPRAGRVGGRARLYRSAKRPISSSAVISDRCVPAAPQACSPAMAP